jgi:hypothetical protein
MKTSISILLSTALLVTPTLLSDLAIAQPADSMNGPALADLIVTTLGSVALDNPSDRRGARNLASREIAALPEQMRVAATTRLLERLRRTEPDPRSPKADIVSLLGTMPVPWATQNTGPDSQYIYGLYKSESDDALKSLLDQALSNARGLYRDGIKDFSSTTPSEFTRAPAKLKAMADNFPDSRYAENASFYLGQYYVRAFFLLDAPDKPALIKSSNAAFEEYVGKAENHKFVGKLTYFAAGHFYRGLNGWIVDDLKDARNWLNRGSGKFTDDATIYVYRVIPNDALEIIDRFLPAKTTFNRTLAFLNASPSPPYSQADALTKKLRER